MGAPSPFAGSACHPEGFSPAPAPKTRTLTGSSIHIDGPGLHLIEQFEGYTRCAFFDTFGGVWTVGFGQTRGVHQGTCFPVHSGDNGVAAATANLKSSVESEYQWAVRGLGVSFNQNQVDALDSFAYNLGAGIFTGSLRTSIQHHNPFPMLAFDHAGGVVLSGLSRRRHEEVALFLKPAHEETPAARAARVRRERTARLHADYRARRALDRTLARFHCLHGYRGFSHDHARKCTMWRAKHGAINRDIKRLRAAGIR
jgi:lysozyme